MISKMICPICHSEVDRSVLLRSYEPAPTDQELCCNEHYTHVLCGDGTELLVRNQVQEEDMEVLEDLPQLEAVN